MMYTKSMIEHVQQIRKMVPLEVRPRIRLANPDLLDQLSNLYWELQDSLVNEKIETLMKLAGPAWVDLLHAKPSPPHCKRTYRGVPLEEEVKENINAPVHSTGKSKVMYRGHRVVG